MLYHLSSEQEMKALIRLCRCNRLICAFDVRKGIKQVFLWTGSIYFYCLQGSAKGAHAPPTPRPHSRHCRIMNDFFFFFGVRWLCVCGGRGGAWNLSSPYPIQSIYICVGVVAEGTGGYLQDSAWLALVIKPAGIIFAA